MTTYTLRLGSSQGDGQADDQGDGRGGAGRGDGEPPTVLDPAQAAVRDHPGGPLLVLAGPGTGKTTTMVETVVDLVERRGVPPEAVLALTFSRKAAEQLRDRVVRRLGRATGSPVAATFHSFAYTLVRRHTALDAYAAPLRLLTAPQQDVVIRELLQPSPEAVTWPPELAAAVRTRGFARELQGLLSRARALGMTGDQLRAVGEAEGRPAWVAAGRFLDDYLHVLDATSSLDYADLVARAVRLAEEPDVRARLRAQYSWVLVDEYQDTDPGQVALLHALAGDGRNLVAVGDPDQSIYAFRGADVRGILDFPSRFRTRQGAPAPVLALSTTRRFGSRLLGSSRRVAAGLPVAGSIPASALATFRDPAAHEGAPPGEVQVLHLDSARAEVEHVADLLRRAHLVEGLPWSAMAVLVRSGQASLPSLRRGLVAAGIPVEVAADDTPVTEEPAVRVLLAALRAALELDGEDPQHPDHLDAAKAEALLLSPVGGLDAAELRALGRWLHRADRARAARHGDRPHAGTDLLRDALRDPAALEGSVDGLGEAPAAASKVRRLARLLRRAHAQAEGGASAEEVLWTLWEGTTWPARLHAAATSGGAGSPAAHRDLDAICALFEEAGKAEEQRGHTSTRVFLAALGAQRIPGDSLAERGVRGSAVRLLTAHRAKGLEWPLVVLAQVQEGLWPDLRRRSTLLRVDELGPDGALPPLDTRALLAEERRLFYVACTRARERLVVTAVASSDEDGDQPSRFTSELGVEPQPVRGRPARPLSLPGLVAELRRTATDPRTSPALRDAAAARLARLADRRHGTVALAPAADPRHWWGVRERTRAPRPMREEGTPVVVSASTLAGVLSCPTKWFLEREAAGARVSSASQGVGSVVHALADGVARGALPGIPERLPELMTLVDEVWPQLRFRAPWSSVREHAEVEAALRRFLEWHDRQRGRTVLATECSLEAVVEVDGEPVRIRGYADRLELDDAGRVVVVDLKTGKYPPTAAAVAGDPQLGLYQRAVEAGAVARLAPGAPPGGAELVQLRSETGGSVKVQPQPALEPGEQGTRDIDAQLSTVVRRLRAEEFPAVAGDHCTHCDFVRWCPAHTPGSVVS